MSTSTIGGPALVSQEQLVRHGAHIVIATPGRCARLAHNGALQTQNVKVLVVDEADAMLGPEHYGVVEKVISAVAKQELQSIFISASLPADVRAVIDGHLSDYELVDLVDRGGTRGASAVQTVSHLLCKVAKERVARLRVLLYLLHSKLSLQPGSRCIIFVDSANEAKLLLSHPSLDARARNIHGDSTTQDRDEVLSAFANREFDVLVVTDVVSRGIDLDDVSLVLQLHPPRDPAQYVHRAGRTGRAWRSGCCIMLYDGSEHNLVQRIREATKQQFRMESTPNSDDLHTAAVNRILDELLSVRHEEYTPLLPDAKQLLEQHGSRMLATAMAVLDGRHASLQRAARQAPSLLSGRQGYVCLLAYDPGHKAVPAEADFRRLIASLLKQPVEIAVGDVRRTVEGWAVDIEQRYAAMLVEELRTGRRSAPFELSMAQRIPRLLRAVSHRGRRAPWASLRKRALRGYERLRLKQKRAERRAASPFG